MHQLQGGRRRDAFAQRPAASRSNRRASRRRCLDRLRAGQRGLANRFWCGTSRSYREMLAPSGLELEDLRQSPAGVRVDRDHLLTQVAAATAGSQVSRRPRARWRSSPSGSAPPASACLRLQDHPAPDGAARARADLAARFPLVLTSAKSLQHCHSAAPGHAVDDRRQRADAHGRDAPRGRSRAPHRNAGSTGSHRDPARRPTIPRHALKPAATPAWSAPTWLVAGLRRARPARLRRNATGHERTSTRSIGNEGTDPISGSVPHRS